MVSAKQNVEVVRNGRRSRDQGAAIAGGSETSQIHSDDDSKSNKPKSTPRLYNGEIRIGRDHQAVLPPFVPPAERRPEMVRDRDLLIWSPATKLEVAKVEEYIALARDSYGYNDEQACGLLFWHKHDIQRAVLDLPRFTPSPEEFTEEDKMLFKLALQTHGKYFQRIRQILPHKSIASLVKYFYSRKLSKEEKCVEQLSNESETKQKLSKESSECGSENDSLGDIEQPTTTSPSSTSSSSILGPLSSN